MKSGIAKKEAQESYKKVTEIYENGETSAAAIARQTSIPPRTVSRFIKLWKAQTPVNEIKVRGRPPKITNENRSFIGSEIARNQSLSSKDLQICLLVKKGVEVGH
jgi:transposase